MTSPVYVFPRVGRTGLGNMLFSWARAEIFAHEHGLSILAPQWVQPKIGPLVRGEMDKRYYVGLFDNSSYIRGLRKWMLLLTARRIPEDQATEALKTTSRTVVEFSGLRGWFPPLLNHRELVSRRLHEIISSSVREQFNRYSREPFIGAHVRRGDKDTLAFGSPVTNSGDTMPLEWFINCVRNIRQTLGHPAPVRIFSDGRPDQLRDLLALENVTLVEPGSSILDILRLSLSRILITTGTSSFSSWAVYLSRMPSFWYPGTRVDVAPPGAVTQVETDLQGQFDRSFAQALRSAWPASQ